MAAEKFERIVDAVSADTGYSFGFQELFDLTVHTALKAKRIGYEGDDVLLLFENELRDHVTRIFINLIGGRRYA